MKYRIYKDTLGRSGGLVGALPRKGFAPHDKLMYDFDKSEPAFDFELPPKLDKFYRGKDRMRLTPDQAWVIAKVVQEAFTAGAYAARDAMAAKRRKRRLAKRRP